jgi:hypothetical protein
MKEVSIDEDYDRRRKGSIDDMISNKKSNALEMYGSISNWKNVVEP